MVLLLAAGCSDPDAQRADEIIQFAAPEQHTVESGESLSKIAKRYGVSVEELKAWNGLETDAIEPGGRLLVWQAPRRGPMLAKADPNTRRDPRDPGRTTPRSGRGRNPSSRSLPNGSLPDFDDDDEGGRPRSVTGSGIFGSTLDDNGDDGLADAVAGLENRRYGDIDPTRRTADFANMEAERSGDMERRVTRITNGPQFPDSAISTPRMTMPAAKRCKAQGSKSLGDEDMYAGEGLTGTQIKTALRSTLGVTRRCMPAGTKGKFQVIVEINVGCNGRVKNTYTINGGGAPSRVTDCIEKVLSYTSFPAHDMPDGQSFQYPINYNF